MSVLALSSAPQTPEDSCVWDLLSDDVVVHEIITKVSLRGKLKSEVKPTDEETPFHPCLVLQCARRGVFPWSPTRLSKVLALSSRGPYVTALQTALESNLEAIPDSTEDPKGVAQSLPLLFSQLPRLRNLSTLELQVPRSLSAPPLPLTLRALKLDFWSTRSTPFDASSISLLTALTSLSLSGPKDGPLHFPSFQNLQELSIDGPVTATMLHDLDKLPCLRKLALDGCTFKEGASLGLLSTITTISHLLLDLGDNPGPLIKSVPPNLAQSITKLCGGMFMRRDVLSCFTALRSLTLCSYKPTYELLSLDFVRSLPSLTSLDLLMECIPSLGPLTSLSELVYLDLGNEYRVEFEDASALSLLTQLTHLSVWGIPRSYHFERSEDSDSDSDEFEDEFKGQDSGSLLKLVLPLRNLKELNLTHFWLNAAKVQSLSGLSSLTFLSLQLTETADYSETFAPLGAGGFQKLRSLALTSSWSRVDLQLIEMLCSLPRLTVLNLCGNLYAVTPDALASLTRLSQIRALIVSPIKAELVKALLGVGGALGASSSVMIYDHL